MVLDAFATKDDRLARELLGELWTTGYEPTEDSFLTTYVPHSTTTIGLTADLTAQLPISRDAIGLALAELFQEKGQLSAAIAVVESLIPTTYAAVSLVDLYAQAEQWEAVVELTNGLKNEDDFSTYLLIQRGAALREKAYYSASREALKLALAPRDRATALRHLAYVERSFTYRAEGKKAMARKDLERVLAEDATYPKLRELLSEL